MWLYLDWSPRWFFCITPAPGARIGGTAALFGVATWRGSERSDASEP
jgi:hypothetical protein